MKLFLLLVTAIFLALYIREKERNKVHCIPEDKSEGFISDLAIGEQSENFIVNNKIKGKIMALTLTDTQQAEGTLVFIDKKGKSTDVADGAASAQSSDETIMTVSYDDASNKVTVVAVAPGVAALSIKAKSQNGNDIPFEDVAVEVKSGDAVSSSIEFATPTEQADAVVTS